MEGPAVNQSCTRLRLVVLSVTCSGLSLMCVASPILPGIEPNHGLDDVISLAGLEQVRLDIKPIPRQLAAQQITVNLLRKRAVAALGNRELEVVEDSDAPTLEFTILEVSDPAVPGALAFSTRLSLFQNAQVDRLDRKLVVPTYTTSNISIDLNQKVKETFALSIEQVLERFSDAVRVGTLAVTGKPE